MTDNPQDDKLVEVEPPKWKLDIDKRQFIAANGTVLQLQAISWLMAEQIRNNMATRPKIPKVRVSYADGQFGEESNPNDPKYKEDMELWTKDCDLKAMVYSFGNGVVLDVPPEFATKQLQYFPNSSDDLIKYFYIGSLISPDEYGPLITAIMGLSGPTEDGVRQAIAKFPRSE